MEVEEINPYGAGPAKHEQVREMFNNIAPAYDRMNRLMTAGIDRRWRRLAVRTVGEHCPRPHILDIATGTGDMAVQMARTIDGARVTGVDLSAGMIAVGQQKVAEAGLAQSVTLQVADALSLPFADATFDAVTVAFGVRNFEHLQQGYAEMLRVLRPGGLLCVLELSRPRSWLVRPGYEIYTRAVIPAAGKLLAGDARAYTYLPRSIAAVPAGKEMCRIITDAGFDNARHRSLTLGVCSLYTAIKPSI